MAKSRRFPKEILNALRDGRFVWIRAGTQPHRFIGIWAVVVEDRVFVRSWSLKPGGWYRTLVDEPCGAIKIADREIAIRTVRARSERLKDEIDRAYLAKYNTRASIKYARGLGRTKSRATTTELLPL